jgi:hypothetical protein
MTIGVIIRGPHAGAALVKCMASIEKIASGSIGGFVSLVVLRRGAQPVFYECQTGGVNALFGVDASRNLPSELMESDRAALISSGPNRPEPLHRFLSWDKTGNMVSGHRFPHTKTSKGIPLNESALGILRAQGCDQQALVELLQDNATLDAGLVAMDSAGHIFQGDTNRVQVRGDTASLVFDTQDYAFAITLNSIRPPMLIVNLLGEKFKQQLDIDDRPVLCVSAMASITAAKDKSVEINDVNEVININTPETCWFSPCNEGALIETGTPITRQGVPVGRIQDEPYVITTNGKIESLSGLKSICLRYALLE